MTQGLLDRETIERANLHSGGAPLLIALSGGGDSTALLHIAAQELGASRLRALVIDHGLRVGSAEDATRAAHSARALGVAVEVRPALWPPGAKRNQAAARAARYRALCESGVRAILLAHTLDDQAETVLIRAGAGSSWRGLAGMAPVAPAPVWPEGRGVLVARPLLRRRREALRRWLRARAIAWLDDPANANPAFERVRVRARLAALEGAAFDPRRLAALAARLRAHAERLDEAALDLMGRAASFANDVIRLDAAGWNSADPDVRRRALSVVLTAAGGAAREPSPAALARLDVRLLSPSFRGAALGGARIRIARQGWEVSRDPGALTGRAGGPESKPPAILPAGAACVWDNRLHLAAPERGWRVRAGACGAPVLETADGEAPLSAASARWLLAERVRHLLGRVD